MKIDVQKVKREVVTVVEEDKTVFIAENGVVFNNEIDCLVYEHISLKLPINKDAEKPLFKKAMIKGKLHCLCSTEEAFRKALLTIFEYYEPFCFITKGFLKQFWDSFPAHKDKWFYAEIDDSGDNVSYYLHHSLDLLGELKEYVQEYSELQRLFVEEF